MLSEKKNRLQNSVILSLPTHTHTEMCVCEYIYNVYIYVNIIAYGERLYTKILTENDLQKAGFLGILFLFLTYLYFLTDLLI